MKAGEDMKRQFHALIALAMKHQASDIHFTRVQSKLKATLRGKDGLQEVKSTIIDESLLNYLRYIAHLDLGSGYLGQSGNFIYEFQGTLLNFRFSYLSTTQNITAVLRILNNHEKLFLEDIMKDKELECFKKWCQLSSGLVVLSGPTGSGKTTLLHACMKDIANRGTQRIVTLEDPIEIVDDSYIQLQINEKVAFTYEYGIKELMRHDPDVVMIGEVRDESSAKMMIRLALSGHLVFTTVHARNALGVIHRLQQFGIERDDLKVALVAVSSQRLFTKKNTNHKICLLEILEGENLQCALNHQPMHNHRSLEDKIYEAYQKGLIDDEDAKKFIPYP